VNQGKLNVPQCWQIKQSSGSSPTSKGSELLEKKFSLLRKAPPGFSGISKPIPPAAQGGHREVPCAPNLQALTTQSGAGGLLLLRGGGHETLLQRQGIAGWVCPLERHDLQSAWALMWGGKHILP